MNRLKKSLSFFLEYQYLEYFSYLLMLLWGISPIIEYILKYYTKSFRYRYFVFAIRFIGILGIIVYIIYLSKKIKDKSFKLKDYIPHILIIILLILGVISSINAEHPYISFFGEGFRKEGLIVYIMYFGFILSSSMIKNKKYIKNIFKVIIISALFITIMPFFRDNFKYKSFSNIYFQFNHYGYFLMISTILTAFMFVDNRKCIKKIVYLLIYIFLLYILIRNNTFGCYLAIFISLLFSLIYSLIKKYKRRDIIILLIIFIISSFLISKFDIKLGEKVDSSSSKGIVTNNILTFSNDIKKVVSKDEKSDIDQIGTGRGILWKEAWNYTLDHPLIGGGIENLKYYYKTKDNIHSDRPHNIILQISSFIGIPGAIIYIILILYLAISNLKKLSNDSVNLIIYMTSMCYFISSNFGNSMFYTSPYFMILLGLLISMQEIKKIE